MKLLSNKILAIVTLLVFSLGCDNFLAEEPRSIISPDAYFKSDKEAITAVKGLYSGLITRAMYKRHGIHIYYKYGADMSGPNRLNGHFGPLQSYTIDAGFDEIRPMWRELYSIITNANLIISKVTGNESLGKNARDQAMGEALFLRAFAYYHLTNMWGDVPYYRKDLPLSEVQILGQTDKTNIRQDLIQDLKQAMDLFPSTYPDEDSGRATKWAAKTLIVKIDLWLENWEDALDMAVDVINNSSHRLLNNFADVFKPSNEYNDEIIYQVVFAKDLLGGQAYTDPYTPRIRDEPKNEADRAALQDSLAAHSEGFTGFGYDIPLPGLVNNWPADDMRKQASLVSELYGYDLNFTYFRKLWDLDQINSPRQNHGNNVIIFRLADVYLMAAEAENELNGPANAYHYINSVRERAFEPDQPLSGLTQQQFREAIHDERKWELASENHRRMDLIRWGILVETVKNTEYVFYDPAPNIQPYHVLLPIPDQELERNHNLKQNPGY